MNTDIMIASANFTTSLMLFVIAAIIIKHIWAKFTTRGFDDLYNVVFVGVTLGFIGWATHRLWWWLWRLLRYEGSPYADWFVTHGYVTIIPFVMIWVGAILTLAPVAKSALGPHWFWICKIAVIFTYTLTYWGLS